MKPSGGLTALVRFEASKLPLLEAASLISAIDRGGRRGGDLELGINHVPAVILPYAMECSVDDHHTSFGGVENWSVENARRGLDSLRVLKKSLLPTLNKVSGILRGLSSFRARSGLLPHPENASASAWLDLPCLKA